MKLYFKLLFLLTVLVVVSYMLMDSVEGSIQSSKSPQLKAENPNSVEYYSNRSKDLQNKLFWYKYQSLRQKMLRRINLQGRTKQWNKLLSFKAVLFQNK